MWISLIFGTCQSLACSSNGMQMRNHVSPAVSLLIATLAVVLVGVLKIINSDLMKPTFDDLLNA